MCEERHVYCSQRCPSNLIKNVEDNVVFLSEKVFFFLAELHYHLYTGPTTILNNHFLKLNWDISFLQKSDVNLLHVPL